MRRLLRIDASLASYLAICDDCRWRAGPTGTKEAADQLADRHRAAEHPRTRRDRQYREHRRAGA